MFEQQRLDQQQTQIMKTEPDLIIPGLSTGNSDPQTSRSDLQARSTDRSDLQTSLVERQQEHTAGKTDSSNDLSKQRPDVEEWKASLEPPPTKKKRTSKVKSGDTKSKTDPVKKSKSRKKDKSTEGAECKVRKNGKTSLVAKKSTALQPIYQSKEGILWTRNPPSDNKEQQRNIERVLNSQRASEQRQEVSKNPSVSEQVPPNEQTDSIKQTDSMVEVLPQTCPNPTIVVKIEQDESTGRSTVVNIKTENTAGEEGDENAEGKL